MRDMGKRIVQTSRVCIVNRNPAAALLTPRPAAQVVAGALLAVGVVNCGVMDEVDPALALLSGAQWWCAVVWRMWSGWPAAQPPAAP